MPAYFPAPRVPSELTAEGSSNAGAGGPASDAGAKAVVPQPAVKPAEGAGTLGQARCGDVGCEPPATETSISSDCGRGSSATAAGGAAGSADGVISCHAEVAEHDGEAAAAANAAPTISGAEGGVAPPGQLEGLQASDELQAQAAAQPDPPPPRAAVTSSWGGAIDQSPAASDSAAAAADDVAQWRDTLPRRPLWRPPPDKVWTGGWPAQRLT
jgi:hypothetical protein